MSEPSLRPFEGKVIAVTGAARGIGRAVAVYLGKRGASLAISDIAQQGLTEVAEELSAYSSDIKIQTTVVDVSKADQVQNWIEKTVKEFGRLDGAANIAGIARTNGLNLEAQEDATWDKVLNVNLTGTMYCLREEVKHIAEGGSIVNASSVLGIRSSVFAGDSAYVASKHGVLGLTRNAAREYGKKNIRVNCINPLVLKHSEAFPGSPKLCTGHL